MVFKRQFFLGFLYCLLLSVSSQLTHAQTAHSVLPEVTSFDSDSYGLPGQNWAISETDYGETILSNSIGWLKLNGYDQALYALPSNKLTRIAQQDINDKAQVFVGGYNEFGVWSRQGNDYVYSSLSDSLQGLIKDYGEVWRILQTKEACYFIAEQGLFKYNGENSTFFPVKEGVHSLYEIAGKIYLLNQLSEIFFFNDNGLTPAISTEQTRTLNIVHIQLLKNRELLLASRDQGLFRWDGEKVSPIKSELSSVLQKQQVYCSQQLRNGQIAWGTVQNGLVVSNSDGEIAIQLNDSNGLIDNTVYGLGLSHDGNILVASANGFSIVETASPYRSYYKDASGFAVADYKGIVYLGTNKGLIAIDKENQTQQLIPGSEGQVWSLMEFGGLLFCSTYTGAYLVDGKQFIPLYTDNGVWSFIPDPQHENKLVLSHYNGLSVITVENGTISSVEAIQGMEESIKEVIADESGYLAAHHTKGIHHFRINFDSLVVKDLKILDEAVGLSPLSHPKALSFNGRTLFTFFGGLYCWENESVVKCSDLSISDLFTEEETFIGSIRKVDEEHSLIETGKRLICVENSSGKVISEATLRHLSNKLIPGFSFTFPWSCDSILLSTKSGFTLIMPDGEDKELQTQFIDIAALNPSTNRTFDDFREGVHLPHHYSDVTFSYALPSLIGRGKNSYRYRLKGYNESWSEWEGTQIAHFTNLTAGDYFFEVEARDAYYTTAPPISLSFSVLAPWYKRWWALLLCSLGIALLVLGFMRWYQARHEKELARLAAEKEQQLQLKELEMQQQLLLAEQEMVRSRNEQLALANKLKSEELANSSMNIISKNKILSEINSLLLGNDPNKDFHVRKLIERELVDENQWELFDSNFSEVHQDFLERFQLKHTDLGSSDLRLSAFLRMNMSTKEIAEILNISVRGVETARYRLRKKLELDKGQNLNKYILSF